MKIVIDIPDEEYTTLSKMPEKEKVNELSYYERVIANGIPLPKGHGRLVDVKDLDLTSLYMIEGKVCCTAPTVIEADKENKE